MSYKRRSDYKPPRERREILQAVLVSAAVIVVVGLLVWFLRPNRDSGSTTPATTPAATVEGAPTTVPSASSLPPDTTVAPASTSTP